MRVIFVSVLILISSCLLGSPGLTRELNDSLSMKLSEVKSMLYSMEWEAKDAVQYAKMVELIEFIENTPIDSLVVDLNQSVDTTARFFTRDIQYISEVEDIEGYIRAWEINNSLINIEEKAKYDQPLESIMVPEIAFAKMSTELKLLSLGDMEMLVMDSVVMIPDSILLLKADAKLMNTVESQAKADSLYQVFLDEQRMVINDSLVMSYRDSVIHSYRVNAQLNYINRLKSQYTDSIAQYNLQVLEQYNDSISNLVNQNFKREIKELISYVYSLPYQITVSNYFDESVDIKLRNGEEWYQWIWLKNAQKDSIGLRIENVDKNSIKVLVDETVNLSRVTEKNTIGVNRIQLTNGVEQKLKKVKTRTPELSPWKLGGKAYTGFTQTYINDYWAKGGNSTASVMATLDYDADYKKDKVSWENGVNAKLGMIYYLPEEGTETLRNLHKNTDYLEMNSRFGYSAFKEWYYSAEANFKSQFFVGYKNNNSENPNSALLSPAYLTFSGGFDYKPNKKYSMFLAPLSVKTTYVTDERVDETSFGLLEGARRKARVGLSGKVQYKTEITNDISISTKNSIFVNYGTNTDGESQFLKVPDFDSQTTLNFRVNQFVTTQLNFHFIYDKDVQSKWTDSAGIEQTGTKLQVKQLFTLGFSYKFLQPFI